MCGHSLYNPICDINEKSKQPTTRYVQVTGALGTLQELILHSPGLHKSYIKNPLFAIAYISG